MTWFNKYYRCSQGHEWQDEWDCLCDDRCPVCNESCSPYDHAEIDEDPQEQALHESLVHGQGTTLVSAQDGVLTIEHIPFIMFIRKDYTHEETPLDFPDGCVDLRDLHSSGEGSND